MATPVSASQGAMRPLPMKLESVLSQGLRAEERKKLRILQVELQGLIDNYLLEPSEVESPSSTANSWMEGVRDLSYDIDDFIYELTHVVVGGARINVIQKPPRFNISRFREKLERRQWIKDDISGFRTRIKEAIQRHKDYLGCNLKWRPNSSGQPPASPPSRDTSTEIHLVGVDSSMEQLCGWLGNDGRPEHKVASIVGPAGVGKTTLAKQVYRMLGGQFDCRAFMRTSRKPDMKGLLTNILSQVRQHRLPDDDPCDVQDLVLSINAHLQDKTYLIIIEDLWSLSTWDLINRSLPKGNRCSRILTTTEVEVIAQACCADNSRCIIKKEPLSEDESTELFLSTAFGKQTECPQQLKEVSNEIIKRSGGLPLAINILASLLARQPASSIEQWHYIKNALSPALITNFSLERINQVLNLGYDNLPHSLKACMLYLCLYEEGCVIWKDDLVKQWIAEDFICAVEGDDRAEVARSYFCELVNRGMIQPVDINCNDETLSCTVHHMVLQFIRDMSMAENFCIVVDHSQTTIRLADKVRRLALHFGNVEHATPPRPESMRLSKVRSVAFSGFLKCMPSIVDFRFLQVLILKLLVEPDKMSENLTGSEDLSGSITEPDALSDNLGECDDDLGYNFTGISELFRLRYFHLDACHMSVVLPTKMQQLKDLVTLEIDAEVTALPSDIVDLPGLLYLSIPSKAGLPAGIGRMTSLCTLGVFDLSKNSTETVMSLVELTNLQELRLTCSTLQAGNLEKNLECLGMIVRKLRNLKRVTLVPAASSVVNSQGHAGSSSMIISWPGFSILPLPPALLQTLELSQRCCIFYTLPEWTKELTNLCILKIAVRELSREDIAILKGLTSLAALSLFISTASPSRIMFDDEGFSVLKYFKFVCVAPCLAFLNGAMPKVRKVKLGFNANRMKGYSLDDAGFERLMGLTEIYIKIRGTGTGADEHTRKSTQLVCTHTIGKDPRTSTINVQWVDWDYFGDEEMYIEVQKEIGRWTSTKQGMIIGESSDAHAIEEKNLKEDTQKHANTRTYTTPESTLHQRNTDLKLSFVKKGTDGIAEKHEGDNDGYGDIFKSGQSMNYIPFHTIEMITNEFSEDSKIGMGWYGDVYKAVYNGRQVAVKLLHVDMVHGIDDQQYVNEVGNLLKVKHPNIVQLLGYSYESRRAFVEHNGTLRLGQRIYKVLCFEYLHGGSLDVHLREKSFAPEWSTRYMIIKGICEGLDFLHRCEPPIFHLDLKPANVLLDSSMVSKVADFGLSRLFTKRIIGTMKYMPPEFIQDGIVSRKSDVFSLGVVMIEIMTGSSGYSSLMEMDDVAQFKQKILTNWKNMVKATSEYPLEESHQVQTCINTAMRCLEPDRNNRPTIAEVLDILNKTETHIPKRQLADH